MENLYTNLNTIITIIAIIIGLPTVFILLNKYIPRRRIDTPSILSLEDKGLTIENQDILSELKTIKNYNILYFPVVPTPKPNIIHLLFCNYINLLSSYGLKVNVFVFDHYYKLIHQKSENVALTDVDNFIEVISKYLSSSNNINIIKESSFVRKKGSRILRELLSVSNMQTLGDIKKIQKDKYYITEDVSFSRFMKPLFNMLYLRQTSSKYGFTLSGIDEKELWLLFEKTRDARNYKLCNMYIPKVEGLKSQQTDVLDTIYNIYFGEKKASIKLKVESYFSDINNLDADTCIALFIKICLFSNEKEVRYKLQDNNFISIQTWPALREKLQISNNIEKKNLLDSISTNIFNTINLKK